MANKSHRFDESAKDTPGPGSYNLNQKWIKDGMRDSTSAPASLESKGKQGAVCLHLFCFISFYVYIYYYKKYLWWQPQPNHLIIFNTTLLSTPYS